MAKISARGAREIARVCLERDTPDDELVSWRKVTYLLRSDGALLRKSTVRFRSDGRLHDWGWELAGKYGSAFQELIRNNPGEAKQRWIAIMQKTVPGVVPC